MRYRLQRHDGTDYSATHGTDSALSSDYGENVELTKEIKSVLLTIPTLDVVIGKKRSPLMIAATQTTASLYKCFSGELRKIAYPEM